MREPQRFPLGTRVANPVEGRTGEIKAFDPDTGLYTLVYNDDHRDVLNASQTQQLVIRKSPEEEAKEAEERRKEKESDPNQYLGATVTKSSTSYEGKTLTSSGQVTQYFADIKRFRVLFSDGLYSDMTIDEVKQNLMLNDKKSDSERKRSGGHDAAESLSSKKKKKHHHHDEEKERPLNTQKFDSRKTAYTICREVLRIILSQKKVAKNCTEKQKVILNNKDLQVWLHREEAYDLLAC
ncbi:NADH dehydrogenase 1 beta subcomplex subunit 7 [Phytophthora nicotianae]|uniref:NADH dehydrogenase 1 beta subcomplex subunit 7 n=1 Tax=Phytophthora nicotianae TaxID=4792 RepID=A0A0W8DLG9_PHYNI|nr:NADH dehydrogenase 1 beta subcomplex subunit 7 [Phytophthora nicotianae]